MEDGLIIVFAVFFVNLLKLVTVIEVLGYVLLKSFTGLLYYLAIYGHLFFGLNTYCLVPN